MKYMGSKRALLSNGLGQLILREAQNRHSRRVVDLFCGAASVSWFAAENSALPVLSIDLQSYATVMAAAVVARGGPLQASELIEGWLNRARQRVRASSMWQLVSELDLNIRVRERVAKARDLCLSRSAEGLVWSAYGGYYFSPRQALTFDYMLGLLPNEEPAHTACLAATISSASRCAAAPGHTAQPFQPSGTAARYLLEAWSRDPLAKAEEFLVSVCPRHARIAGTVLTDDALNAMQWLGRGDLVIVDPPYSAVHYSRFYHVLETIARGKRVVVTGSGRYPPQKERPRSVFSVPSKSREAMHQLLSGLAEARSTVILTFPAAMCSNGLSGQMIARMAQAWFRVREKVVHGRFSTLGGNNTSRAARSPSEELILLLEPSALS